MASSLRTAAQQALEALETCDAAHPSDGGQQWYDDKLVESAITALHDALAEQQEPVRLQCAICGTVYAESVPPQVPVQEPVGEVEAIDEDKEEGTCHAIVALYNPINLGDLLYTAPPQRKPLSEEEIQAAWDSVDMRHPRGNETRIAFARAIERAHGIGSDDE